MRKIISILIALGLILGLSVMAVPAAAQPGCGATVTITPTTRCEGATSTYCINFTAPVTLMPNNDLLSVEFAANTTFGTWVTGDITVSVGTTTANVSIATVDRTATKVVFPVPPALGPIYANNMTQICIGKVVNPPAGTRTLRLSYKLVCCPEVVWCSVNTTIVPRRSTYDFFWSSAPTYPGIAAGFIPPFQACGQNVSYPGGVPAEPFAGGFLNAFNITLRPITGGLGCAGPCTDNVTVVLNMTSSPTGANVTIGFNSSASGDLVTLRPTATDPQPQRTVGSYLLGADTPLTWQNYIHFNTPGTYTLCFRAICPPEYVCPTCELVSRVVAEECFTVTVHQWKEAFKLELREKWNLISLPLVPLVEGGIPVADALASITTTGVNNRTNIMSIWHYDRCAGAAGTWFVWPTPGTGQTALARLDAGKAYWVRVFYPIAGCGNITWWIFGTQKPVPPASPAQYPVCTGWNMLGFTSLTPMTPFDYLWNWRTVPPPVYGWQPGCWDGRGPLPQQGWNLINFTANNLTPGSGYWVAFPASGAVFVP